MGWNKMFKDSLLGLGVLGLALGWVSAGALAQAWPAKPVRMIVTFTPGSAVDLVARTLSDHLPGQLGQPVLVENRPGASTTIGAAQVQGRP
jgi:tripartite-type tricarboxylate transporter receptor subunit TctC